MKPHSHRGFTLIEILVVLVLLAALVRIAFMLMADSGDSIALRASADELRRIVAGAKQVAALSNRSQDLRWYRWKDTESTRLAVCRFAELETGKWQQADDPWILSERFAVLENETNLFAEIAASRNEPVPRVVPGNAEVVSWIVHPSGKTHLAESWDRNVGEFRVTLAPAFVPDEIAVSRRITLFLNPATASIRLAQP